MLLAVYTLIFVNKASATEEMESVEVILCVSTVHDIPFPLLYMYTVCGRRVVM